MSAGAATLNADAVVLAKRWCAVTTETTSTDAGALSGTARVSATGSSPRVVMQALSHVLAWTITAEELSVGQQQSPSAWFAVAVIRHWQAASTLAPTNVSAARAATVCRTSFPVELAASWVNRLIPPTV